MILVAYVKVVNKLVKLALDLGHTVVLYLRDKNKVKLQRGLYVLWGGELNNRDLVAIAIKSSSMIFLP